MQGGFQWKESSLQVMAGGDANLTDIAHIRYMQQDRAYTFVAVDRMLILGEMIDNRGCTATSIEYRLSKAEGHFWANSKTLCAPAPVIKKLDAWCQGPQASALHGASTWHLTGELLHKLWSWELKWLRKVFRLRRRPDEAYHDYMQRTASRIEAWMARAGRRPIHVATLRSVFLDAFCEKS